MSQRPLQHPRERPPRIAPRRTSAFDQLVWPEGRGTDCRCLASEAGWFAALSF